MFNSQERAKHKAIIFDKETRMVSIVDVYGQAGNMLETKTDGVWHVDNAITYVDEKNGGIVYVYNVDLPAKVEADHLKTLRRSAALKRMFDFEKDDKTFDWFKFLPYLIIMLMVFFK
ncbi:hypothetical protein MF069_36495 [Paenibacillus mucilaginosus]|uniref:hypothetical protein n=1 Tax=Paenibacillus mucilaginosus TaxID=61624 RepID=UPI001EEFD52A|nr:hypothetical protein [Paenibacillus mucilaginosus]MCG7218201.1 hypothetical protein [Paenibacillus mucilaginosus]